MLASSVQTATSIAMDRSRIETHIKPLLGPRLVSNLTLRDVEAMQADIAAGKSARGNKAQGRGGRSTGGAGVAARAISTFRALLGHATRLGLIEKNPASGVRHMASRKVKRRRCSPFWQGDAATYSERQAPDRSRRDPAHAADGVPADEGP